LALAILFFFGVPTVTLAAPPEGFGTSLSDVVSLAKKEGKVRIGLGFSDKKSLASVLRGFSKKFPGINVEYSTVNSRNREKIFTEVLAGRVEYDVVDVSIGVQNRWRKAKILSGPFDWSRFFPKAPQEHFSPNGYFAAGATAMGVLAYNPKLVPRDQIPRNWEDCLDPHWKGQFVVDTKARIFTRFYHAWGEEKLIAYAKKLKNNNPIWIRGMTNSLALLAAGEVSMICGTSYSTLRRMLMRDPQAAITASWPKEIPSGVNKSMGIMKGAKSPNAALLLAGWLASTEGSKGYDALGYGSPFLEETESWKLLKNAGAKAVFAGWEKADYRSVVEKKIVAAWGFP